MADNGENKMGNYLWIVFSFVSLSFGSWGVWFMAQQGDILGVIIMTVLTVSSVCWFIGGLRRLN